MRYLSVFKEDGEVLKAISDIHLKGCWYDLDCTYSKGVFYKNIQHPKIKSDIHPLFNDVIKADAQVLDFIDDNSLNSIVFDPPFLFRNRKAVNNDKICARFSYFKSYEELMQMYRNSLDCFMKKLKNGGIVAFKCQDMTDGRFYCSHNDIINYATKIGFVLKDIAIKATSKKNSKRCKATKLCCKSS